ncbi:hypothetical protein BDP55DRAFT_655664 [Colletotrichum godetiae]|uniref:Uncharacterized protein n=1 Tax=Colletotrichum godetiae TaxID=1209918 RepID=A0AAJ0ASQ9_9PEZI|nr:uncharacterized protein BDP55DRAFT_655664 [Colletotrichum godetiae]KAK1688952.1 hypothetical protein BDP55DRAFT_655664 [Colletotrichum godetiae]
MLRDYSVQHSSPVPEIRVASHATAAISALHLLFVRRLEDCRKNHARCNDYKRQLRSLRQPCYLLDLGSWGDEEVWLIEPGKSTSFAILSYCRGQPPPDYTTTSANLQYSMAGFLLKNFPKTIRDAVWVTLGLGLR